jgi:hypothetical protein
MRQERTEILVVFNVKRDSASHYNEVTYYQIRIIVIETNSSQCFGWSAGPRRRRYWFLLSRQNILCRESSLQYLQVNALADPTNVPGYHLSIIGYVSAQSSPRRMETAFARVLGTRVSMIPATRTSSLAWFCQASQAFAYAIALVRHLAGYHICSQLQLLTTPLLLTLPCSIHLLL